MQMCNLDSRLPASQPRSGWEWWLELGKTHIKIETVFKFKCLLSYAIISRSWIYKYHQEDVIPITEAGPSLARYSKCRRPSLIIILIITAGPVCREQEVSIGCLCCRLEIVSSGLMEIVNVKSTGLRRRLTVSKSFAWIFNSFI